MVRKQTFCSFVLLYFQCNICASKENIRNVLLKGFYKVNPQAVLRVIKKQTSKINKRGEEILIRSWGGPKRTKLINEGTYNWHLGVAIGEINLEPLHLATLSFINIFEHFNLILKIAFIYFTYVIVKIRK